MKKVLLVTDGLFHPHVLAQWALYRSFSALDGFKFKHIRTLEKLPPDLDTYQAIVLYFHHKRISESALSRLEAFITGGGGLIGVHSATASFKENDRYFELLGGRFAGHGPVERFAVTPVKSSEIFGGLPAFDVFDELYLHDTKADIKVHFTAKHEGNDVPAVWTRDFGEGRVVYAVPGHTTGSIKNDLYQKLLKEGLLWVINQ